MKLLHTVDQIDLRPVQDVQPFAWISLAFQERPAGRSVSPIFSPGFLDHHYYLLDFLRFEYGSLSYFFSTKERHQQYMHIHDRVIHARAAFCFAPVCQFPVRKSLQCFMFHFAPAIARILSRVPLISGNEQDALSGPTLLYSAFLMDSNPALNRKAHKPFSSLLDLNLLGYWNRISKISLVNQALMSSTPRLVATAMAVGTDILSI